MLALGFLASRALPVCIFGFGLCGWSWFPGLLLLLLLLVSVAVAVAVAAVAVAVAVAVSVAVAVLFPFRYLSNGPRA